MCLMLKQSSISGFRLGGVCASWAKEEFLLMFMLYECHSRSFFFFFLPGAVTDEGNGLVWLVGVKQSGGNDKVKGDQIQTVTLW